MNALAGSGSFRAGAVNCVCPPGFRMVAAPLSRRDAALLGVGAAASVLSQTLMFGLLPLVGRQYAPEPGLAPMPFVALLVGAVAATFPASILRDAFGRRAAFALGASLGIAGGLVLAWGLVYAAFWPIVLGAFWLGIANGFALQYRHAAAAGVSAAEAARSIAVVVGVSGLVGLVAPSLAGLFEASLTPALGAGTALLAAAAHILALGAALLLRPTSSAPVFVEAAGGRSRWLPATVIAAIAWFAMTAVMVYAPLGLAGCGIGLPGAVGLIAWHVVAMYAPAGAIGLLVGRFGAMPVATLGVALVALAATLAASATILPIALALILSGVGWSLATSAAVVALHEGLPSRLAIAAHDFTILAAAIAGAFASQLL